MAKRYGSKFSDLNPVTGINLSLIIPTYNQRVMDVEMGTFTPLVFGTNGGMGLDCQNFLRTLANKLWTKNDEPYACVISWLRIHLSFAILRTVHRCVRGSRYPFKSREVSEDFTFAVAGLHLYS